MIPKDALQRLSNLETSVGQALPDVPVGTRDQFAATLRDDFREFDIDINDQSNATVAFAAAYILAQMVFHEPIANARVALFTAYLLRSLSDKALDTVTPDIGTMPTFKQSWRSRIVNWLYK